MPTEKQRRDAERRRLKRQLERRAAREARRRRFAVIASVAGTLVLIAVVIVVVVATSNDSSTPPAAHRTSTPATPSASTTPAAYPCTWTKSGTAARQVSLPPTTTPPKTGKVSVLVSTTRGSMSFQLDRALAPCTVESFASLAEQHFYDGSPCHRLTATGGLYVLQCGDPLGTGQGGPGYTIPEELSGTEKYTRGVIAMARTQAPHSGGSQFFIVYKDSTLPPNYTIFGKVTSGMNVVDKVAAAGSDPAGDGKPKLSITLTSVGIVE